MRNKNLHEAVQSNNPIFAGFNYMKFCPSGDGAFNYFIFQTASKMPWFLS